MSGAMSERCWAKGCDEPICEADKTFSEGTAKFCEAHSREADDALAGDPAAALAFAFAKTEWWRS